MWDTSIVKLASFLISAALLYCNNSCLFYSLYLNKSVPLAVENDNKLFVTLLYTFSRIVVVQWWILAFILFFPVGGKEKNVRRNK